jgi:hypothetical protein
MRRIGILAATVLLSVSTVFVAQGATKPIAQIPMTQVANLSASTQVVGMAVRGKMIYLIGTVTGVVSTDGFIQAMDSTGAVRWSVPLDNGSNEIATAATFDSAGNLWVVGSAQTINTTFSPSPSDTVTATASPTPSPTSTVLNPDGITVDPLVPMRKDLSSLAIWKISPSGALLARYATELGSAFLVRGAILANNSVAVVGIISTTSGHAGFLIQSDLNGSFSKPILVGKSDTELNALAKKSDGSLVLIGSSSETIAKKARVGIKDGVIVVLSKAGKMTSVIRSSNSGSTRSWQSGTNSFFLAGDSIAKSKSEAVATKFGSTFSPTWTMRFASSGAALVADGPTSHFFLFPSIGAVTGIKGWKPSRAAALVLNLDAKGALKGAYGAASITTPIAIGYSPALGVVVLGRGPEGVSVFHTLPR